MGTIRAETELVNPSNIVLVDAGALQNEQVRRITIGVLVDTGAYMLCINEDRQAQLKQTIDVNPEPPFMAQKILK